MSDIILEKKRINYLDKMPLISVIICVYNVLDYIDECFLSLTAQTYKNLEFIVIDDGSTDGCAGKCNYWAKKDNRIRLVHTENRGLSAACNYALNMVTGDYITFCDPDDFVDNDMYELMIKAILEDDSEICFGGFSYYGDAGHNEIYKETKRELLTRDEVLEAIYTRIMPKKMSWNLRDKLFKKEVIGDLRFDVMLGNGEDVVMFWNIMKRASTVTYLPLYKYHYRMRSDSIVHSKVNERQLCLLDAMEYIYNASRYENDNIRKNVKELYMEHVLSTTRGMLELDAEKYRLKIQKAKKYVRSNILYYMFLPNLSIRKRLGVLYLLLPFWICFKLRTLVKK